MANEAASIPAKASRAPVKAVRRRPKRSASTLETGERRKVQPMAKEPTIDALKHVPPGGRGVRVHSGAINCH